jgi:hypothetical protein
MASKVQCTASIGPVTLPLMAHCVARKSRVFDGPAVRGKELLVEPSRGYIICWERYADDGYAHAVCM